MRKLIVGLCIAISSAAYAADVPPTENSIKELLQTMDAPQVVDMVKAQLTGMETNAVQQSLQGHAVTPEMKKILDANAAKVSSALNENIKWATLEPIYIQVYQSSLTQEEVDGIAAFYKTTAGKAMVKKMPALMQASMGRMQQQFGPVVQKLQQIQQQTALEIQAENAKHS